MKQIINKIQKLQNGYNMKFITGSILIFSFSLSCTHLLHNTPEESYTCSESSGTPNHQPHNLDEIIFAYQNTELNKEKTYTPLISINEKEPLTPPASVPSELDKQKIVFNYGVDIDLNEHIKRWIHFFSVQNRSQFQRFLNRGAKYREVVNSVLQEYDLPLELYYLAMIESGFTVHARSKARAVGVWQFISGTARRYGLIVNRYVDERKDPIRSTEAAAKYLKDLHNAFQSWELAMAAYNCGEFKVLSTIMKGDSRDFWDLVKKNLLPRETRNYVPKFIAAVIIGTDPEKYGFTNPVNQKPYPDLEAIEVPSPIRIRQIAKSLKIPLAKIKEYNPHLKRGITPASLSTYDLWIPKQYLPQYAMVKKDLKKYKLNNLKIAPHDSRSYYQVRKGDSLFNIARTFGTSVRRIKRLNNLYSNRIMPGQKLRVSTKRFVAMRNDHTYTVRQGDYLGGIARKYGISLTKLKRLNGLSGNRIYEGQKLRLNGASAKSYKVKPGDSLYRIASLFNTTVNRLKKINGLRSNHIVAGQILSL